MHTLCERSATEQTIAKYASFQAGIIPNYLPLFAALFVNSEHWGTCIMHGMPFYKALHHDIKCSLKFWDCFQWRRAWRGNDACGQCIVCIVHSIDFLFHNWSTESRKLQSISRTRVPFEAVFMVMRKSWVANRSKEMNLDYEAHHSGYMGNIQTACAVDFAWVRTRHSYWYRYDFRGRSFVFAGRVQFPQCEWGKMGI